MKQPGAVEKMLEKLVSRAQWLTVSAQSASDIIVGLADSTDLLLDCEAAMKEYPPELRTVAAVIDRMVKVEDIMALSHEKLFPANDEGDSDSADVATDAPIEADSKESTGPEQTGSAANDTPKDDETVGALDSTVDASADTQATESTNDENAVVVTAKDTQATGPETAVRTSVSEEDKMLVKLARQVGEQARKLQQVIAVESELVIARLELEMKRRAQYTENELEACQRTLQETQQAVRDGPKQLALVPKVQVQMKSAQFAVDLAVTALAEKLDVRSDALLEQSTDALAEVLRVATDAVRQTHDIVMELKPTIERREKEDQFQRQMLREGQASAAQESLRELDALLAGAHPQLSQVPSMAAALEVRGRLEQLLLTLDIPVDITAHNAMLQALADLGTRANNVVADVDNAHAVFSVERPALQQRLERFNQRKAELDMNVVRKATTLVKQTVCLFNYEPIVHGNDTESKQDEVAAKAGVLTENGKSNPTTEQPSAAVVAESAVLDGGAETPTMSAPPTPLTELEKQVSVLVCAIATGWWGSTHKGAYTFSHASLYTSTLSHVGTRATATHTASSRGSQRGRECTGKIGGGMGICAAGLGG